MSSSASSSESRVLAALVGPTAVGKTALAIDLAERFRGEIVSCDSMQVYRGFDIGTDKPSAEDRRRVPHHLIDIVNGREQFTAADFAVRAAEAIAGISARGRLPLVVGGTGLYLRALLDGLFPGPARDPALRAALDAEARREGLDSLWQRLHAVDPAYAAKIGRRDRIRIVRGLEVHATTGIPLSEHFRRTSGFVPGYRPVKIGLRLERADLRRRIDARIERMFERGLVEETRSLLAAGLSENDPPFRALGYRHVVRVLRGEIGVEEAKEATRTETRQYAKRQLTWFRAMAGVRWFDAGEREAVAAFLAAELG